MRLVEVPGLTVVAASPSGPTVAAREGSPAFRARIADRDATCAAVGAVCDGVTLERAVVPECAARPRADGADWLRNPEP